MRKRDALRRALRFLRRDAAAAAPRAPDGELVVRRREIHSGRALSVSTVEWSVAERTATPTSALEGYMWEKETQVDRLRERVPLANLLSQTKAAMVDPQGMQPRDWAGAVTRAAGEEGRFVIVPVRRRAAHDPAAVGPCVRAHPTLFPCFFHPV